jgi:hypothetical protein
LNAEFRKLWVGQSISAVGSGVTLAISIGCQFVAFVYVATAPLRRIRTTSDLPALTPA